MKKSIFIVVFFCLMLISSRAHATLNIPATIQTVMELQTEISNKVEEYQKMIKDIETRVKEGFDAVSNCIKNPTKCDVGKLQGFIANNSIKRISKIPTMPGSIYETSSDPVYKMEQEALLDATRVSYIYKRGKDSMKNLHKNRKDLNNVINEEDASLFAKGAVTRHVIFLENDEDLYSPPEESGEDPGSMSKILARQGQLSLITANRLARILELRANMVGAEATAELKQQSREEE